MFPKDSRSDPELLDVAIYHASIWYMGTTDKTDTEPYILHALRVMFRVEHLKDYEMMAAAVLHDVIEDCDITKERLEKEFNDRVAHLVDMVSRPPERPPEGASYKDWIESICLDADAVEIKIADTWDNMNRPMPKGMEGMGMEGMLEKRYIPSMKRLRQAQEWHKRHSGMLEKR